MQPLDRMTLALAIDIGTTTGITMSQMDCKHILALVLSDALLLKIAGVKRTQAIGFPGVFNVVRALEAANKTAGLEIYPEATQMLSEINAQLSAAAAITNVEINWTSVCEHIIWPHLIISAQERLRDLRSGVKKLISLRQLPAALQMRFGPLMVISKQEKGSALHKQPSICFEFERHGSCKHGDSCRYVHEVPVKKLKTIVAPVVAEVCFDFKNGKCTRGDKCRFAHI